MDTTNGTATTAKGDSMATRGITKRVRRQAGESDASFLQRAVHFAAARGRFCRLLTEMGPLCQRCAPFATTDLRSIELCFEVGCYNCEGTLDDPAA